jgi:hypothetical protein
MPAPFICEAMTAVHLVHHRGEDVPHHRPDTHGLLFLDVLVLQQPLPNGLQVRVTRLVDGPVGAVHASHRAGAKREGISQLISHKQRTTQKSRRVPCCTLSTVKEGNNNDTLLCFIQRDNIWCHSPVFNLKIYYPHPPLTTWCQGEVNF